LGYLTFSKNIKYIPDPKNGFYNFTPSLWLFFARGGADCSGWADINYYMLKKLGYNPKLYDIVDCRRIDTWHTICVVKVNNHKYFLFNVNSIYEFETEKECLDVFKHKEMIRVKHNGVLIGWKYHVDSFFYNWKK
jgi:hypothetical protein